MQILEQTNGQTQQKLAGQSRAMLGGKQQIHVVG